MNFLSFDKVNVSLTQNSDPELGESFKFIEKTDLKIFLLNANWDDLCLARRHQRLCCIP